MKACNSYRAWKYEWHVSQWEGEFISISRNQGHLFCLINSALRGGNRLRIWLNQSVHQKVFRIGEGVLFLVVGFWRTGGYSHSAKGNRIRPDFYHRQQQTVLGRQDSPCSWFPFQIPVLIPVPVRQPGLEFQSRGIFAAGWAMVGRCRLINRCISLKSDPTVLCLLIPLTGARGHSDWCLLGGFTFEGWSTTVIITGHQSSNADAFSRIMVYLEGWTALLVPLNSFADAPITNGWSLTGTVQDAVFMS